LYEEDEDEFVTPDQIRGNQFGGMANQGGFAPNSAQAVANEEDEDEFVTPDQIRNPSFGQPGNPWGLPPTRTISNPVTPASNFSQSVEDEEDEFVTPDQIRGNQFGATGSQGGIAPKSTLPKLVTPPPPPLATPEVVADILQCPLEDTQTYLPGVLAALQEKGILDKPTLVAAIATIGVETGGFCPINEYGGESYFTREYEGRQDLGNIEPGDGVRFHGRGFIQITGRANYRDYSQKLGLGSALVDNPDLALDAKIGAQILACYFYDRSIDQAAKDGDWRKVRRLVNGGYNGWDDFNNFVQRALQKL
jgi:predicted chitinase